MSSIIIFGTLSIDRSLQLSTDFDGVEDAGLVGAGKAGEHVELAADGHDAVASAPGRQARTQRPVARRAAAQRAPAQRVAPYLVARLAEPDDVDLVVVRDGRRLALERRRQPSDHTRSAAAITIYLSTPVRRDDMPPRR